MTDLIPTPSNFLIILIVGIAAVILIVAAVLVLKKRQASLLRAEQDPEEFEKLSARLDYQPDLRPVKESRPPHSPSAGAGSAVIHAASTPLKTVELVQGRADITASLHALTEKYSLEQVTLATDDGLVFASSGSMTAQNDAAFFGSWHSGDPQSGAEGVQLFALVHKGSDLTGIVRSKKAADARILSQMSADTKDILNWWI